VGIDTEFVDQIHKLQENQGGVATFQFSNKKNSYVFDGATLAKSKKGSEFVQKLLGNGSILKVVQQNHDQTS
jgi:hypothetical protein